MDRERTIEEMIAAKARGIDCTAAESAHIKEHLRAIERAFPLEWDEAHTEPAPVNACQSLTSNGAS